jgi:hypothetical protein
MQVAAVEVERDEHGGIDSAADRVHLARLRRAQQHLAQLLWRGHLAYHRRQWARRF